ncbi:MAG TPA: aldo/keto reductase [Rudaea sp.]|nr:aldo/keto reductase [Rudaea sp.]
MKTRAPDPSGLQVSELGLGCNHFGWRIDEAATGNVVHAALDAGINVFDTADSCVSTMMSKGFHVADQAANAAKTVVPLETIFARSGS